MSKPDVGALRIDPRAKAADEPLRRQWLVGVAVGLVVLAGAALWLVGHRPLLV